MSLLRIGSIITLLALGSTARAGEDGGTPHFATPPAPAPDARALARTILGPSGCQRRLMGSANHPFVEAQLACDAFLSFALVDAIEDKTAPENAPALLRQLLADALGRARAPFLPDGSREIAGQKLPPSILYRGLLLLMLAGQQRAGAADEASTALFDALARNLAQDLEARPFLPTFGSSIWPCDHAPAAAGLVLHGKLRHDERTAQAGAKLTASLVSLLDRKQGFPTRIDAKGREVEPLPRGTALAWTAAFLSMAAPDPGERFTQALLTGFCDDLLGVMAACREWPRGVNRLADAASGPIVEGYGVGASALAIAATHASRHGAWHRQLLTTGEQAGLAPILAAPARYPLENAMVLWARSVRTW